MKLTTSPGEHGQSSNGPDEIRRQLADVVQAIAERERWSDSFLDFVMYQVDRQPAFALLPDLHHFRDQLTCGAAVGTRTF